MAVVRDRKIRTALRTNQIVGFVTVPAWKKIKKKNYFQHFIGPSSCYGTVSQCQAVTGQLRHLHHSEHSFWKLYFYHAVTTVQVFRDWIVVSVSLRFRKARENDSRSAFQ